MLSAIILANSIPSPITIKSTSLISLSSIKSLTTPPTPYTFLLEFSAISPICFKIECTLDCILIKSLILVIVEINTIILDQ